MKSSMKTLFLTLMMVNGFVLAACATEPVDRGPDLSPAIQTVPAAALEAPSSEAAARLPTGELPALTCPGGSHESCYEPFGCGCCPTGKVLDCFGPDDCYCCSGTSCM
jgi:hypothetical protein